MLATFTTRLFAEAVFAEAACLAPAVPFAVRVEVADFAALDFDEAALHLIAKEALKRKTGARGLRSIIESIMRNVMYEVPSIQGVTACQVTKDVVVNRSDPILTIDGTGAQKMAAAN